MAPGHRITWFCVCTTNGVLHSLTLLPGWVESVNRRSYFMVWFLGLWRKHRQSRQSDLVVAVA